LEDASEDDPVSRKRRKKLFGAEKAEEVAADLPSSPSPPPVDDVTPSEATASPTATTDQPAPVEAPAGKSADVDVASVAAASEVEPEAVEVKTEAKAGAKPRKEPAAEAEVEPAAETGGRRPIGEGRPLPRVIAVANQKGGVGKTTTSVNLSAALAELGHRTLVVDLDPQGNAGTGLGIDIRQLDASIYDVLLHETPLDDCIEGSSVRNLFVAPSSLDLAGAEIELVPAFSREHRLRQALEQVRDDFDYVIIDCPPSLGLLTVNAFAAASEVLVPIQCEYYALEGLGQLMRNVDLVQRNLNPKLEISAVVLVMYDGRTNLALQVAEEVRSHFGDRVCQTVIPRSVRLSEAPSFGQPITTYDSTSRGAIAYRELAKEVSDGTPKRAG
jgi:chromosome partitioning protein